MSKTVSNQDQSSPAGRPAVQCPNCSAAGMRTFYSARDIPTNSCLLFNTRQAAVDWPRRDLELGFCPSCGFIANTVFDASVQEYSTGYEESQGCSPRFNTFLNSLVESLIERYEMRAKDIIEIGCGKGDFLIQLCRAGGNRGIGIDPTYDPARQAASVPEGVRFIQDFYSDKYAHLAGDMICCRHTLEHIGRTGEFMRAVRSAIGAKTGTLVFWEVPDMFRVLREGAFWDIYYEHCSYFSPGSLARLFWATGFELLQLELDYDDQYILLVGRAVDGPASDGDQFPLADDLAELAEAVDNFGRTCPAAIAKWRQTVAECAQSGRKVAIWGSGSKCVAFLTTLGIGEQIDRIVDINPHRHGKYMPATAHRISPPESLRSYGPDLVIIMNPIYRQEIAADLAKMGLAPEILTV